VKAIKEVTRKPDTGGGPVDDFGGTWDERKSGNLKPRPIGPRPI
jgi:hypothetical protein